MSALPMAPALDDESLVRRAIDGDRWAMEALYRRHVRRVTNAVTRVLRRLADADDVVQQTFLIGFSRLSELRDPGAFRGWICQIAMNEVRGRLRKRKWMKRLSLDRQEDDVSLEALASHDASPAVIAELAKLDVVLTKMDTDLRMAWMLRYVEGWSLDEVSSSLGCSLATTKRRIKSAREFIDAHVQGGTR